MSEFARLLMTGLGILAWGLAVPWAGFWFRGRHVRGRATWPAAAVACVAGMAFIVAALCRNP